MEQPIFWLLCPRSAHGSPNKSYIYSNLLFSKVGTVGTVGTRGENTCVPTVCLPRQKSLVVGTPGRSHSGGRWCVVTCPADREPPSLFALWLNHSTATRASPKPAPTNQPGAPAAPLYQEVSRAIGPHAGPLWPLEPARPRSWADASQGWRWPLVFDLSRARRREAWLKAALAAAGDRPRRRPRRPGGPMATCALQPFTEAPFSYRLRWQIVRGACGPSGYGHGCAPDAAAHQGPRPPRGCPAPAPRLADDAGREPCAVGQMPGGA